MEEFKIRYPSGFEQAIHMTREELEHLIRLMAALKMFELGKVSSGKAAELAGMSRIEFLETCSRYRVSLAEKTLGFRLRTDLDTAIRRTVKWHKRFTQF